uniref:Uncharacterized protein n=1 Tax=Renouxia sp. TaxID=2485823 RepID=A0A3G3MH88_9FLOR|nr:hypothetical protein [Renouxia sp.]
MIKYFGFLMSLLNPFGFIQSGAFVQSSVSKPSVVAMAPSPGDLPSKMANSAATPSEGCRHATQSQIHQDGSRTETVTMTCSKKRKYDKAGNLVKETDTSKPKYETAKSLFFDPSGAGPSPSSKKK